MHTVYLLSFLGRKVTYLSRSRASTVWILAALIPGSRDRRRRPRLQRRGLGVGEDARRERPTRRMREKAGKS
jgi:hypothetical protein